MTGVAQKWQRAEMVRLGEEMYSAQRGKKGGKRKKNGDRERKERWRGKSGPVRERKGRKERKTGLTIFV